MYFNLFYSFEIKLYNSECAFLSCNVCGITVDFIEGRILNSKMLSITFTLGIWPCLIQNKFITGPQKDYTYLAMNTECK